MKFLPHGEMLAEETSLDRVRLRDQDNVVKDYWKDFEFEPKGTCNRSQIAPELVPYKTRIYVETPQKSLPIIELNKQIYIVIAALKISL